MNAVLIDKIITKSAEILRHEYNYFDLKESFSDKKDYLPEETWKFVDHLTDKGQKVNLTFLKNHIEKQNFVNLIQSIHSPILVFKKSNGQVHPILITEDRSSNNTFFDITEDRFLKPQEVETLLPDLLTFSDPADIRLNGKLIYVSIFPYRYIASDYFKEMDGKKEISTVKRLFRLLQAEKKDIFYVYIYAVVVGLISLSLPLGIQATISMISGGMIFSSVIVLIALVILGILIGGGLQVMQITIVEILQQRLFAKAAFEMTVRLPKIKLEAFQGIYPPELMNRFFDVVTIQKGLPKLFVDITGSLLQIFFGLILLSLYHPFFLIFSILLIGFVAAIFYITGPNGLRTSIIESKYKYKIAYWLEELSRTFKSFKLAANTNLPLQKMDELVNNYLFYRKAHFKVLLTQFINIVAFKTIITGGLLIIGTILVVERQISLGQFVASEVIIILVVNSVEKLVVSLDVIYDLLTGVDKVAAITDLPVEDNKGLRLNLHTFEEGVHIQAKDLKYKYSDNSVHSLKNIEFEILPGESICLAGANNSGKHTLMKILSGITYNYEGILTLNHISVRDINKNVVRSIVGKSLSESDIFDGSILDNITMGRNDISYNDVVWAIGKLNLINTIAELPDGLYTHIGASGRKLSSGTLIKILLARSVVFKPKLLIVNDFSEHIPTNEKMQILSFLQDKSNGWNLIIVSVNDDPVLLASCDRILLMKEGVILTQGKYDKLISDAHFQKFIMGGN